jgi:hypothetical protein
VQKQAVLPGKSAKLPVFACFAAPKVNSITKNIEMTAYSCQSSPYNAPLTSSQSAPA